MEINALKSIAFTGHRKMNGGFDEDGLYKKLEIAVNDGFDTFLIGMALGFDTVAFHVCERLKNNYNIKIVACIPCPEQDLYFNEKDKKEYQRMVAAADERVFVSQKYDGYCMMKRNIFMVDNSAALFAYFRGQKGGTEQTINYAVKNHRPILYL